MTDLNEMRLPHCLILEGPDGAGKTSLAQAIFQDLKNAGVKTSFKHHGAYPHHEDKLSIEYLRSMLPGVLRHTDVLILDRSWLSEPIYGEVHRQGANRIGLERQRILERVAMGLSAVVVNCRPPFDVCQSAFNKRRGKELLHDDVALRRVYDLYGTLAQRTELPVMVFDYTQHDPFQVMFGASKLRLPENRGPGIGAWRQGVSKLIVAERPNTAKNGSVKHRLPFVAFTTSGCSVWLAHELNKIGVPERDLYWINAFDHQGLATDAQFVNELQPKAIIALGPMAADWCHQNDLEYIKVPHPQYHKRFYQFKQYPLVNHLRRI